MGCPISPSVEKAGARGIITVFYFLNYYISGVLWDWLDWRYGAGWDRVSCFGSQLSLSCHWCWLGRFGIFFSSWSMSQRLTNTWKYTADTSQIPCLTC